jgi:dolichol-phosphate mannosyltransferase
MVQEPIIDDGIIIMLISIVVPVYNEQDVMPHLFHALSEVLSHIDHEHEIIIVNDGSRDGTADWVRRHAATDDRIKLVNFSRNFGQQAAMTAGLDCARGDVVVVMDCDLQDPPELLQRMLDKYSEGYDVVSCRRISRAGESWFKKKTASAFYGLMRKAIDSRIPAEVGDFRLFSRNAVDAIRAFREQHRFMRGLVAWLGLREAFIEFDRPARVAGETKYPVSKLIKLAWTAISSSSTVPLRACVYAGWALLACGLLATVAVPLAVLQWLPLSVATMGWTAFQLSLAGIQLVAVGLIGDYVGRIFEESKQRPLYIVSATCNVEIPSDSSRSVWMLERPRVTAPGSVEERDGNILRIPTQAPRRAA